jgi:hypothetical protein
MPGNNSEITHLASRNRPVPDQAPLSKDEFKNALKKGLGRALIHVRQHGLTNVSDLVLEACLHNWVLDQQSESRRTYWLWEMFKESQEFELFREAVLNSLVKDYEEEEDTWDLQQRFSLAERFALHGDAQAHEVIRKKALKIAAMNWHSDWLGADELISLEGVRGMLDLARVYGERLRKSSEDFPPDFFFWQDGPERSTYYRALLERSANDPTIEADCNYLRTRGCWASDPTTNSSSDQTQPISRPSSPYTLDEILQRARKAKDKVLGRFRVFGRAASREDLAQVYAELLGQTDEAVCLRLLWVFGLSAMPELDQRMLDWAGGESEDLRDASIEAMAHIHDPRIRQLALKLVGDPLALGNTGRPIILFRSNYEEGDGPLIYQAILSTKPKDENDAHSLVMSILDVANLEECHFETVARQIIIKWGSVKFNYLI